MMEREFGVQAVGDHGELKLLEAVGSVWNSIA
jgi:hypothetical protein